MKNLTLHSPYFIHQLTRFKRIHRAGIKVTLGVPRSTSTKEMHSNTSAITIEDVALCRLVLSVSFATLTSLLPVVKSWRT